MRVYLKETEQSQKKSFEQLKDELLLYFFDSRLKGEEDRFMQTVDAYATAKAQASCEATPVSAPSESQEEMWKEVYGYCDYRKVDFIEEISKRFTVNRKINEQ